MTRAEISQQSQQRAKQPHALPSMPIWARGRWSWVWVVLSGTTVAAVFFTVWEWFLQDTGQHLDTRTLYSLYITRSIALAVGLVTWATGIFLVYRRSCIEQLRRSELAYRQLIEDGGDATVVFDPQGVVMEWNRQAARLFGYSRDDVLGRPLPTLPTESHAQFLDGLGRLAAGRGEPALKYAAQRVTKSGEVVDVSLSRFPLRDAKGRVTGFMETACDIRACGQLVRKLQQVEKMSSMGQLAAGVAHQLNTPLASALLRAQMLEEDVHNPEQVEDLRFIQQQLRYGKEIVEGLLRFSRPSWETKRQEAFNPILHGVLGMLRPSVRGAGVRVVLNVEATEGALVYVGRNELEQAFFNLCSNALDAMPQGGELTITTGVAQDRLVEIHLQDTGTGIPKDRLPRIFEPFYTTKEPGKGTGLGLAICWRIIEEAGGSIAVSSAMGEGTTFSLRLPLVGLVPNRAEMNKACGVMRSTDA